MRELVFYWLRLYRNNQSLLRRRFPDFANPGKKKFHYFPRLSIINSKIAGKPIIQGDESGAGVSFGFV